jgi:hypothetical protein
VVLPIENRVGAVSFGYFDLGQFTAGMDDVHDIGDGLFKSGGGRWRGIEKRVLQVHLIIHQTR